MVNGIYPCEGINNVNVVRFWETEPTKLFENIYEWAQTVGTGRNYYYYYYYTAASEYIYIGF